MVYCARHPVNINRSMGVCSAQSDVRSFFIFMRLLTEKWRPLLFTSGKYKISSYGRVMSVYALSSLGELRMTGTILKASINRRGYEIVKFQYVENGKVVRKTMKVHRLVCMAFHPNPENKPQVNHKDLNQLNNWSNNLEWATAKENTNHAQRCGRMPMGRKQYIKKGRPSGFRTIIHSPTGTFFESPQELADLLGVKRKQIHRWLNGERANPTQYAYC